MLRNILAVLGALWIISSLAGHAPQPPVREALVRQVTAPAPRPAPQPVVQAATRTPPSPALAPEPPKAESLPSVAVAPPAAVPLVEPGKLSPRTLFVTGTNVNVRRGPGTSFGVVTQVSSGQSATVTGEDGDWLRLQFANGISGWVTGKYLASEAPRAARTRSVAAPSAGDVTRARKEIIRQSIAAYPGSCPCPYNVDRGGRRCGARSAWSRRGGYAPLCYDSDVNQARIDTYLARLRGASN